MDRPLGEYYETGREHSMQVVLQSHLNKTPWWMISLGLHAVLAMILYFVMFEVRPAPERFEVVASIEETEEPLWEPLDPPEEPINSPLPPAEIPADNPQINDDDAEPSTEENGEDEPTGDPENQSAEHYDNKYNQTAIGVGGGAAGKWGKHGLGSRFNHGKGGGGGRPGEIVVDHGLDWLARHQSRDGSWSCDNFQTCCRKNVCDGTGSSADYTPGTTGLSLLAFLGAGNTSRHGHYKGLVKRGLKYLISIQTPDGCVGPKVADGHYMYNHAVCTMALAEAYAMTGSAMLKRPAQQAVDFLLQAQNPYLGWRYGVRPGDSDSSVTGWAVLALKSARLAELNVPPEGFQGAKNWFDKVTDDSFYKTGYTQKGDNGARLPEAQRFQPTEAMTAVGLASRIFMGAQAHDPEITGAVTLLKNQIPKWDPDTGNDFYYWYYGSLAMFQVGGDAWTTWERGLLAAVIKTQRRGGDEEGSWDPSSAWGSAGGRVYATAINTLTMEVYYRYSKVLGKRKH